MGLEEVRLRLLQGPLRLEEAHLGLEDLEPGPRPRLKPLFRRFQGGLGRPEGRFRGGELRFGVEPGLVLLPEVQFPVLQAASRASLAWATRFSRTFWFASWTGAKRGRLAPARRLVPSAAPKAVYPRA